MEDSADPPLSGPGTVHGELEKLTTLNAIGQILNREAEFDRALAAALDRLVDLVGVDTGWVFLSRAETGDPHLAGIHPAAVRALPPALAADGCAALRVGSCECEGMFRRGELDEGINIVHCSRLEGASGDKRGLRIHASVPLAGRGAPFGILNLAAAGDEPFDDETLSLLDAVGAQLGIAYERHQLAESRRREAERLAAREERDRIARDVHDSVSQLLFGADLALRLAEESDDPSQVREAVRRGSEHVSSALRELRSLVELLRSADLDSGLNSALERLVERTTGTTEVVLQADTVDVPEEVAEVLYRTAQEGIHNALRHAAADRVAVRLDTRPGAVRLTIDDDGTGLPEPLEPGVGLRSIEERAASVGGRMRAGNRRTGGTRLEAVIPWPRGTERGGAR